MNDRQGNPIKLRYSERNLYTNLMESDQREVPADVVLDLLERLGRTHLALDYAHHIPGCAYDGGRGECDCGLRELEGS